MKPIVDGLEKELGEKAVIIRLNIQDPEIRLLADEVGFEFTPTFILYDAAGEEIYRSIGSLDTEAVKSRLTE